MDKLSYSSYSSFKSCQRRWYLRKVEKVPVDTNYVESDSLLFGKAYHKCLEDCLHNPELFTIDILKAACEEFTMMDEMPKVFACVVAYFEQKHEQAIVCEYELQHEHITGFIDAVIPYADGWAILDLKTARSLSADLESRLHKDFQLNLYASFASQIAEKYNLDLDRFRGCLYNVAIKPSITYRNGESASDYARRVKAKNIEYFIAKEYLNPEYYRNEIEATYKIMESITERPPCNYSACYSYFSPCPYWSQCYDKEFSANDIIQKKEVVYG